MKKKILIPFTTLAISSSVLAPFSLVGCAQKEPNYDKLTQTMKEQTIQEMFEISKYPRPTGYLDGIRNYLINRATAHGYQVERDVYGNIWFDIPATGKKYESWPKVILQGHMDMVVAGLSAEDIKILPVEPVIEEINGEPVMHSKDYKTSLGADDGIGLSIILSLLDLKKFNHGPIRVIFTADEETGMNGAAHLNPTALDTDYLINIDGEHCNSLARSCAGSIQGVYEGTVDEDCMWPVKDNQKVYQITVTGFKGGHSGSDIKERGNADRFLCELLYKISSSKTSVPMDLSLYYFGHKNAEGKEILWGPTQLITDATTTFVINEELSWVVDMAITETVNRWKNELYKGTDDEFEIDVQNPDKSTISSVIRPETTMRMVGLTGQQQEWYDIHSGMSGLPFGYKPNQEDPEGLPEASANLGPLSISGRSFALKTYSRSSIDQWIDKFEQNNSYQWEHRFTITGFSTPTKYYGWKSDEQHNRMIQLFLKAGQYFDTEMSIDDYNGGLELSWFHTRRPTIHETAIGCDIDNAHNVKETLHLNSLDAVIKQLLYALTHINEI